MTPKQRSMPVPFPPFRAPSWLIFLCAACLMMAVGCSIRGNGSGSSDDDIRAALRAPLAALEAQHPAEAVQKLMGRNLDASVWQRTERTMALRSTRGGQAQAQQCGQNLTQLAQAIELYRADEANGYHLPKDLKSLVGNYIREIPTCPACGKDTYSIGYTPDPRNETFVLVCKGHNHAAAGLRTDAPRYDPRFGLCMENDSSTTWWPANYHADIDAIDRVGSRATVTIRERGRLNGRLRLRMKEETGDRGPTWVVDTERFADEGGSDLGLLLGTYLTALSSPAPLGATDRADCERSMRRVATALEMYSSDHGGRYPTQLSDLVPHYMQFVPTCNSERGEVAPRYQVSTDGERYELTCAGQHPDIHLTNRPEGLRTGDPRVGSAYASSR